MRLFVFLFAIVLAGCACPDGNPNAMLTLGETLKLAGTSLGANQPQRPSPPEYYCQYTGNGQVYCYPR